MEVIQENNSKNGAFIAQIDGQEAGRMSYTWAGNDKIIIDHTEVGDAYGGLGVGKNMLMQAVSFARNEKIKIMPLCPFAKSVFDKDESIHDVLF
jgi:predicted GNAT family acetyltransferase